MDDLTRNELAVKLELLAKQDAWNEEVWQQCYDLVKRNVGDEFCAYIHDDIIHYSGVFQERNLLGFRVKADEEQLHQYRVAFQNVGIALRNGETLAQAKRNRNL